MRCLHEAKLHEANCFVTLTYDEAHVPGSLQHEDFQKFIRRLRKTTKHAIRYYMCGEYGPELLRPHYHACLFNHQFNDLEHWGTNAEGDEIYRSKELEKLWPQGFSTVGDLNFKTAAYTARYCMKKITGPNAKYYYGDKKPEYNKMSLKPGIGKAFLEKYESDIYPNDYVVINGTKVKPPKYYDEIQRKKDKIGPIKSNIYEKIKLDRETKGIENEKDNTQRRLNDKEEYTEARIRNLKRKMI